MQNEEILTGRYYFDRREAANSSPSARHYHRDSYELYYMKEGSCKYFIDNRTYDIAEGDVVLIPAGTIHRTLYADGEHARTLINCPGSFVPESVRPLLFSSSYVYRSTEIISALEDSFERIEKEYEREDIFRDEALRALTAELFFTLARHATEKKTRTERNAAIEHAIEYMQKNFEIDITLSEIAKMCSVTPEHFSRIFKKETGFGFSEYLNQLRLRRAEYLLRNEPGRSVCEIAYACGFNDSNYFSSKFKKYFGISPVAYKKG